MKLRELSKEEFLSLIREDVEQAGNQTAVANRIGVSQQYLSQVLNEKRSIGDAILKAYNATPTTNYRISPRKKEKH